MGISLTSELSNLTKLSAIHLSGPIGGYEAIGTFEVPDLQQLVLLFNGTFDDDRPLPDPVLPLFNQGRLTSLTKLEIGSDEHFKQVGALCCHLSFHTESTTTKIRLGLRCRFFLFVSSLLYNGKEDAASFNNLDGGQVFKNF